MQKNLFVGSRREPYFAERYIAAGCIADLSVAVSYSLVLFSWLILTTLDEGGSFVSLLLVYGLMFGVPCVLIGMVFGIIARYFTAISFDFAIFKSRQMFIFHNLLITLVLGGMTTFALMRFYAPVAYHPWVSPVFCALLGMTNLMLALRRFTF